MQDTLTHHYRVNLFGGVSILTADGTPLHIKRQQAEFLLGYLVTFADKPHLREKIISTFWPHQSLDAGRDNLSTVLSTLRRLMEPSHDLAGLYFQTDRLHIRLNSTHLTSDIAEFQRLRAATRTARDASHRIQLLEEILKLYTGEFIQGCYQDWALKLQDSFRTQYSDVLTDLSSTLEEEGQWERAIHFAEQALQVDPYRDEPVRTLMRGFCYYGRNSRAIETYRLFKERLDKEFGTYPAPATNQLAAQIQQMAPANNNTLTLTGQRTPISATARHKGHSPVSNRPSTRPLSSSHWKNRGLKRQQESSGNEQEFPCPSTIPNTVPFTIPNNLTQPLTPLLGRNTQLKEVSRLLVNGRLLTLTGIGGVGKSRLAIQLGLDLIEDYPDGTWIIDLSDLAPASTSEAGYSPLLERIEATIHATEARAVPADMGESGSQYHPTLRYLANLIGGKQMLIVLDNADLLMEECRELVMGLLSRCPHLKVFTTSREPLGVPGEQIYPLRPLAIPDSERAYTPEQLMGIESIALFYDTASRILPGFVIAPENALPVCDICSKVSGLPFALILAASHLDSLSLQDIRAQLTHRTLATNRYSNPAHRSIDAMLNYSVCRLSDFERAMFDTLSVFQGSFSLHAAEAITLKKGIYDPENQDISDRVLTLLSTLTARSLIERNREDERTRYAMLEITRRYGQRRLEREGDLAAVRDWHAAYYSSLAIVAEQQRSTPEEPQWWPIIEREYLQLLQALTWLTTDPNDQARCQRALNLISALAWFWILRGRVEEGYSYLKYAFERRELLESHHKRHQLLLDLASLEVMRGELPLAASRYEEIRSAQENASLRHNRQALLGLGNIARAYGDRESALELYEECLLNSKRESDFEGIAESNGSLGLLAFADGDLDSANRLCSQALNLFERLGNIHGVGRTRYHLGDICLATGDINASHLHFCEAERLFSATGDVVGMASVRSGLCRVRVLDAKSA